MADTLYVIGGLYGNVEALAQIVDMAAANGGNCPLTEADKVVTKHGVKMVGLSNYPALCPTDASHFYAQNLVNLLDILWTKKEGAAPELNLADDIVAAALVTNKGAVCRSQ